MHRETDQETHKEKLLAKQGIFLEQNNFLVIKENIIL